MKRLFYALICVLLLTGCTKENKVTQLSEIIKEGNYIIVDVRTQEEYDEGHVKGAILIPHDTIDENVDLDKDKTIIVYCRSGNRSHQADMILSDMGYDVFDIGGYNSITLEKE